MPRHYFKFPETVISQVKAYIRNAVREIDPLRYSQEPNYTTALLGRLEGVAYEGEYGMVRFRFTAFDDRGPKSAEYRLGADHAITATVSDGNKTVSKAILVQAKKGEIASLSSRGKAELIEQIKKMQRLVKHPKVMQLREANGQRYPEIISGVKILQDRPYHPMPLDDYFTWRVTTTLDGCTDPFVVEQVQDSSLPQLDVIAKLQRG